jgi:thiamine pyrophosphokinase
MLPDDHRPAVLDAGAPEVCATRDGCFTVARFGCNPGQQVSVFALDPTTHIHSLGLKYPLEDRCFTSWWQGTLNEATGEQFSLSFDKGGLIVYRVG